MNKNYTRILGLTILTGLTSIGSALAQNSDADIVKFFENRLEGDKSYYESSQKVKLAQVDQMQDLVWSQWKEANKNFEEQKLIDLELLSLGRSSSWTLPEELEKDAVMPYYYGYKGDRPENGYPLFLYTHGSGNKDKEWATGLKLGNQFEDGPSIYFIPQIPNTSNYRWWQRSKQFAWERLFRLSFLGDDVDPNKLFIFGISEGGYGSQRLASYYADYLAGAGPMAGGEPLQNAPVENCGNIAFSFLTGAQDTGFDRYLLTQITKDEFERFQKENPGQYDHRIELIPDKGHHIDYSPTTLWLKDKVRNPYPTKFIWDNFEMDGVYRDGFYNLAVVERSNDDFDTRTRYKMAIKDNKITLNVDEFTYEVTSRNKWGLELSYTKEYTPATSGKVIVYLNDELVDLSKKVTLIVNGVEVFSGKVKPTLESMVNSCATFFDSQRVYPASIEVDIK
ncbi:MAG: hypothetical protein R3Y19_06805 [Rikenellaceae bacterium]